MSKHPYTKSGRLSEVLALIQVLALDRDTHRSENGMSTELGGPPDSAKGWFALAAEHPEFFRVNIQSEHGLSLAARHVLPHDRGEPRPTLSPEFTAALLQTAITLHDRQVQDADWWKTLIPLIAAIIAAIIASGTTLFALWLNGWCKG